MRRRRKIKTSKKIVVWIIIFFCMVGLVRLDIHLGVLTVNYAKNTTEWVCTNIISECTGNILKNYQYSDIVNVERNDENEIMSIEMNTINMNIIKAELLIEVQKKIDNQQSMSIYVPIGTLTDIQVLGGLGPSLKLTLDMNSAAMGNFGSEFISSGINQTLHKISLEVSVDVFYITQLYRTKSTYTTDVLISETVIVGNVPEHYTDLSIDN